jgi:hypothetical protein
MRTLTVARAISSGREIWKAKRLMMAATARGTPARRLPKRRQKLAASLWRFCSWYQAGGG